MKDANGNANIVYTFVGTAGEQMSFVYANNTIPLSSIWILNPDGSILNRAYLQRQHHPGGHPVDMDPQRRHADVPDLQRILQRNAHPAGTSVHGHVWGDHLR
jgi:hypothetical protein